MRFLASIVLLAAACTAHNPNFVGDGGGGPGADLAGVAPPDLFGVPADLAGPMGACSPGQRQCTGSQASDRCEAGMFVVDRVCPDGSECTSTYCAPPAAQVGTQIGVRCDANGGPEQLQCMASAAAMLTCQPFVDPASHNLRWFCDKPVGSGKAGTHCSSGAECRSGICATGGLCVDACQRDQDCQFSGTPGLTCKSLAITVEGVTTTVKSCG